MSPCRECGANRVKRCLKSARPSFRSLLAAFAYILLWQLKVRPSSVLALRWMGGVFRLSKVQGIVLPR